MGLAGWGGGEGERSERSGWRVRSELVCHLSFLFLVGRIVPSPRSQLYPPLISVCCELCCTELGPTVELNTYSGTSEQGTLWG